MTRLAVDWTRCDGHGLCARLLSESITLDEWGFPILTDAPVDEDAARTAVSVCPALALRIEHPARTA
ncbi:ferredoxin [Nocardioides sp. GY 10127]|uniref:ferredoxin n=1 Tax=Nocardioides sp. GY 10127 TaxID=2569762 RepID=UPI0010A8EBCE|nr:ferredoxin [Nocardioides sp. GY 10127]TIC79320.1 ferredoxin [Nocardioides sp. GY 10127]